MNLANICFTVIINRDDVINVDTLKMLLVKR